MTRISNLSFNTYRIYGLPISKYYQGLVGKVSAGDSFEDNEGRIYVIMGSILDDFNYWYVVNFSEKVVVKMTAKEAEKFVSKMTAVDVGYCKAKRE